MLAGGFGVGAGLTLDEFALWVYLRDVYWSEEGRASFEAVIVAGALGGLVLLGIAPFDLPNNGSSVATLSSSVFVVLALSTLAILKGRLFLGLIGIFIPLTSLAGACRLAAPRSLWARHFYGEGSKLERSRARFARAGARRRRLADAISGAPSDIGEPDRSRAT